MHKTTLVFAVVLAVATAALVPGWTDKKVVADKQYLIKTKAILQLLLHVHQPLLIPELKDIAYTYKIEDHLDSYEHVELIKTFLWMKEKNMILKKGDIFTILDLDHSKQLKAVFDTFYFAKDWDTFFKTAIWAREHINEGIFVNALYLSVIHREDLKGIILPAPFEIYPHLFISMETVQKAYEARMKTSTKKELTKYMSIIPTNYTAWHKTNMSPELRLSYFTEDVGLNMYHWFYHLDHPFWMQGELYGIKSDRRGEQFWYTHQQLLARYLLERMTNGLQDMEKLTYNMPHIVGYSPNLVYKNGKVMPVRPELNKLVTFNEEDVETVMDFERRIRDTIDLGYVITKKGVKVPLTTEQGMDVLGRLIEETMESVNPDFYGTLYNICLKLMGHIVDPTEEHDVAPSVMEHFETMLRDPMYYRIFARINTLFMRYKKTLPKYTKEELIFNGLHIDSMEVDKLVTYFDKFDMDITNVVDINKIEDDEKLQIFARQPRLNHKPFTYKIVVDSDKETMGMVRVFLGPKMDMNGKELTFADKHEYMIEIDRFPHEIMSGKTTIERNSFDSTATIKDIMTFHTLYEKIDDALKGKSTFYIDETMRQCGFPDRLLLPKGKKYGLPLTMFVMVTPLDTKMVEKKDVKTFEGLLTCGINGNLKYPDVMPMGFPFDREVEEAEFWVPNMIQKDVFIFHKEIEEDKI